MVEDEPSAASARRAYEFAILRVPIRLAKVCQWVRSFPVSVMSGWKSGPEAKAKVIPLKTTALTRKQLFFVIVFSSRSE